MSTPNKNKTSFKTYEASTRLLAAVIATSNVKLDYVEIAKHVGGGSTKDAINHRFRPIKQLAKMQATAVKNNQDPGELPIDKGEIQKLFGESTASGIEWQFREIKNLGKAQKEAVKNGQNPANLPVVGTPSAGRGRRGAGAGAGANTPGSGATAKTPGTGNTATTTTAKKRVRKTPLGLPPIDSSDDSGNESSEVEIDTPSNRASKRPRKPAAAMAASAKKKENGYTSTRTPMATATPVPAIAFTPAPAPASLRQPAPSFEAPAFAPPATSARPSIFGSGDNNNNNNYNNDNNDIGFVQGGIDEWGEFVPDGYHFAAIPGPARVEARRVVPKQEMGRNFDPYVGHSRPGDADDYFEDGEI